MSDEANCLCWYLGTAGAKGLMKGHKVTPAAAAAAAATAATIGN